jgi:hypothetical protein
MIVSTARARRLGASAIGSTAAALFAALLALAIAGCASKGGAKTAHTSPAPKSAGKTTKTTEKTVTEATAKEPDHIQVQHILIGFAGSVPGKNITRSLDDAKTLAYSLLDSAKAGTSFDDLVVRHTDDRPPGIYGMSNNGVTPAAGEYGRGQMVPAFGNVGFTLKVGEIGIADYDSRTSPFGYHIIKRVK